MLTDYHVHLRPDDADATAGRYFTTENVERYLQAARERGIEEIGVSEHVHRFVQALDVWDHPFWREQATDDLDAYCEFVGSTPLKLGIEADYVPGREAQIADLFDGRPFEYVIGSVHFLGDDAVDYDRYDVWTEGRDPDAVWTRYFEVLAEAARSGLFDLMAHPDLVKVWGGERPMPEGDLRRFYEPAVEAFAEADVAVEISTAGLRKPVGEIYPAPQFARMCAEAGLDFALSSDAHLPEHVGYRYDDALAFLADLDVKEICVFEGRRRHLAPLAPGAVSDTSEVGR